MEAVATETLLSAPGQYVLAYSHHFAAARLTSEGDLQVNLSHRTHQWHKLLARAGGGGSALRFCPNQHCMILDYTLLDAVFAIRLVEGSSTAHHTAEWAGTDCPGFPLGSGYIGGSVQEDAKAHWLRITQNRAVALRKKRKHDAQSKANELSFDDLWEMSMSPVCCPTYGVNTSRIRLPLRCLHQAHVPHLAQGPSDFLREALPLSSCSLLEITNKHSRDKDIRFEPCTHTYYVKGLRVSCSVTGLVHMFANEFDPDKCIARMQQGHRWPRPEYSHASSGILIPYTAAEIKATWHANGAEASARGTWLHHQVEVLLNGGSVEGKPTELDLFAAFLRTCPKLMAFRTEWCIYSDDDDVAGCIDFVCLNKEGKAVLFDWKRTKDICNKFQNPWSSMKMPLGHLDDCAGQHYSLQLNLYKHILQRYYQLEVQDMFVVGLHPDRGTIPFVYKAPDMSAEVQMMLASHREHLRKKAEDTQWEDVQGVDSLSSCTTKDFQQGSQDAAEYQGGKSAEACAADFMDMWEVMQFEDPDGPDVLAHPQPARLTLPNLEEAPQDAYVDELHMPPLVVEETRHDWEPSWPTQAPGEWESSDESEDGFWDLRPDWFERAERRLAAQRLSYTGRRLPQEVVDRLPGFFFSFEYLRALACVSPAMCRSVRDREHWRNSRIFLSTDEFASAQTLHMMAYFYSAARLCLVDVRQLAMFHIFPERMLLDWTASVARPQPVRPGVSGFISDRPLMGCATFDLVLPDHAVGLYMGVQEWRGTKRSYCRIDNLFRQDCTVSFALDDMPPQRHGGRNRCQLLPDRSYRFSLRWDQRMLELSVDGRGVSVARLRDGAANAVAPLARVFTWIHVRPRPFTQMASFRPVPSYVRLDPTIRCALCQREHAGLRIPRWAVCPLCDSWICASHCGQTPWRLCPCCPTQLMDYVGGSQVQPYADAENFFRTISTLEEEADKFSCVVRKTIRQHAEFLKQNPLAAKLLPDPAARSSMSKRLWEKVMYRGRAIIAFLDQKKDLLLFRFLHALSEDLSSTDHKRLLNDFPHPEDMRDDTAWRQLALEYSLELQLQLAREQWRRSEAQAATEQRLRIQSLQNQSSRASEFWQDKSGGSWEDVEGGALSQSSFSARVLQESQNGPFEECGDPSDQHADPVNSDGALEVNHQEALAVHRQQDLEALLDKEDQLLDRLQVAKKRRLMPGAADSFAAFEKMFDAHKEACESSFAEKPDSAESSSCSTVLQRTSRILHFVRERFPDWSEKLVRLGAAAITVYRTRYSDMFVRDFVALVWVMEGERFLRAHGGVCYMYHEHGAFQAFAGVPPESTFARVKPFLLQLEGIFHLLSARVERSDEKLLSAIDDQCQG